MPLIHLLKFAIHTRIIPSIFILFNDLTCLRADSYSRTLSLGTVLSTEHDNGVLFVSRSASCQPVSKRGSTHSLLLHSMTLHSTERIHTRLHYPPGRPYPPDMIMVFGLYSDPPPVRQYPKADPFTHFYSIQ
jgi:hypothetical protein